jgi:hypothetical protein
MRPRIALFSKLVGILYSLSGVHKMFSLGPRRSARHAIILAVLIIIFLSASFTAPSSSNIQKPRSSRLHSRVKRTPTRYHGSVPIVDRAKLAEVEARMQHAIVDRDNNPDFDLWDAPSNPNSPPKLTELPRMASKRKPKHLPESLSILSSNI